MFVTVVNVVLQDIDKLTISAFAAFKKWICTVQMYVIVILIISLACYWATVVVHLSVVIMC